MWIFSVRLCRCRVLEETVTAAMVSLMLGGGFGYSGFFSLFFGISCSRRGLVCLRGFCYVFVCVGPAHLVFMEVVFYCSSSVSWVSGFCSGCVCSLLSVVLCTQVGLKYRRPFLFVHCFLSSSFNLLLPYILFNIFQPSQSRSSLSSSYSFRFTLTYFLLTR